ncbi:MAG: sugar transferase [Gammaproteobacteria bacterium SG8_11]|nr:MAG: sugar transferase [Gammaproteobacteria bacterium SG8_11]
MENVLTPLNINWIKKYNAKKDVFSYQAYLPIKRVLDLTLLILFMPFWLPLLGCAALLIKVTSPGAPILFRQKRLGKSGKQYSIYKFRTMVPNAEALIEKYAHLNELTWPDFKITNDPRVTFVGKILRRTSLDELPQLLNVLKGEMSLVGPRPTFFGTDTYQLWHTGRLDVLPGLTGLWQVTGRGTIENFDEKSRLDILYIERACFELDLEILFRTVKVVIQGQGSY